MNRWTIALGCCVALLWCGCAGRGGIANAPNSCTLEFIGSTPGDVLAREFIGGLTSNAECHSITWRLRLSEAPKKSSPRTFSLEALYRIPTRSNPNQSEDGPRVSLQGTCELLKEKKPMVGGAIYRITAANPQRSLSFVKVGDNLLHLLNPDGSLAVGNGGWSYTLNRADHAEKPGDLSLVNSASAAAVSYKISPLATGPNVFGVFEGRTPCHGISRQLGMLPHAGCIKSKWRLTLFQNPQTSAPTTYKVEGSLFRTGAREGTWSVVRGATTNPNAKVYQLNPANGQPALCLLKGDDNVLFFLNQNREPLVGHADFGYTLDRVAAR